MVVTGLACRRRGGRTPVVGRTAIPGAQHMTTIELQTHWAEPDKERRSNSSKTTKLMGQPQGEAERDPPVLNLERATWPPVG